MLRELVRQLRAATRGLRLGQPAVGTQRARPPLPTSDSCKCESQDGWLGLASAPALAQRWDSLSLAVRNASRHGSTARWLLTMGVGVRHSVTVGEGGHTGGIRLAEPGLELPRGPRQLQPCLQTPSKEQTDCSGRGVGGGRLRVHRSACTMQWLGQGEQGSPASASAQPSARGKPAWSAVSWS